jgi:hypothetical protein
MKEVLQVFRIQTYVVIITLLHAASCLFENCDEVFTLDSTKSLTITSAATLRAKNTTSCRYTIIADASHVIKITCKLRFDQECSHNCPNKRFFVSVDGIISLQRAQNFCNRNGTTRIIKRRSIMNRLVMAYVSKTDLGDDNFTCAVTKVNTQCECGWSKQVMLSHAHFDGILL